MQKSESIKELAIALAKAQGEVENATKDSINPHFKSKYADLAEVLNTVRPVFAKHGLSFVQMPSYEPVGDGNGMMLCSVETMLLHSSGEFISNKASSPVTKADPQGIGSAITYLRRYSLAAFAGIAQEDDDTNSASHQKPAQQKPVQQVQLLDKAQCTELKKLIEDNFFSDEEEQGFIAWLTSGQSSTLEKVPAILFNKAQSALKKRIEEKTKGGAQ